MQWFTRSLGFGLVAATLAFSSGGCALIPVAALGVAGNVVDIGGAAFSAGTEVFTAGQLESYEFCTFEQAQAATRSMLNDLRLHLKDSDLSKTKAYFRFHDDGGSTVDIIVNRHSAAVCGVRINVGILGSEAYARLLLKSIRARLPLVQFRPATQPTNPVDLNAPRTYERNFQTDNLDR